MRPIYWLVLSALLLTSAVDAAPEPPSASWVLSVDLFPQHGLPGLEPVVQYHVTNTSQKVATLPQGTRPTDRVYLPVRLEVTRADGSSFSIGYHDDTDKYDIVDWSGNQFDGIVPAGGSAMTAVGPYSNRFFEDSRLLVPGRYDLRFVGKFGDSEIASNVVRYTVDTPRGEDRLMSNLLKQLFGEEEDTENLHSTCSNVRFHQALAQHPSSTYARICLNLFVDPEAPNIVREDRPALIGALKNALSDGLPSPYDDQARINLIALYRNLAKDSAREGSFDLAVQQAAGGAEIAKSLAHSPDPYAHAAADSELATGPWVREEFLEYAKVKEPLGAEYRPIRPFVDCISRNGDGTFTAWFGYENPNLPMRGFEIGAENLVTPSPGRSGQPTTFEGGKHQRVFSVTLHAHETSTWALDGVEATASADDAEKFQCGNPH